MFLAEAFRFSIGALRANPVRTGLTSLGLVIGNASVILVVTISLTSREYILEQIQGVGSNMIYAYYETAGPSTPEVEADYLKWADVEAVRSQLDGRIRAVTGVMTSFDRMMIRGREEDVRIVGSDHHYKDVRNLVLLAGRALEEADVTLRQKVALLTEKLAERLYGKPHSAVGEVIKIHGLQFTVVGVFKERVESFGLSELTRETVLIPITVQRYFTPVERIDPLYVQVRRTEDVEAVTAQVRALIESRHRPGARYTVENLTAILNAAKQIALALTVVLILVAAIALVISGIGIMNIMLVTVTERTREIGVRMAVGASRRDILQQFLLEAVLISVGGGLLGILLGVGIPLSVRWLAPAVRVPVSPLSVVVAFVVSFVVGVTFGLLPANRAARLNPTEALRYE
ncbi:MAG: ABC transporter permease [Bryobacterales bacterium]|nr:ABC transporter permease [Bryobacteraceae bacterium]MDW8130909.1 ABC transporter permease [Bryobacterales bacterium]